jgi:hypothetical protein
MKMPVIEAFEIQKASRCHRIRRRHRDNTRQAFTPSL